MNKFIFSLIIIAPFSIFAATKVSTHPSKVRIDHKSILLKNEVPLSVLISTFSIAGSGAENLNLELFNMNGVKKTVQLDTKIEEYEEYVRYSFANPFSAEVIKKNEKNNLELYVFQKIKPSLQDSKELAGIDDISDIKLDLMVLMDTSSKKTLKVKTVVYYKDIRIAEGSVEGQSQIQIVDDLSSTIKNSKLQELKVTKNLLGSDKRSLDFQIKFAQSGKSVRYTLNINLLNMKQTPIKLEDDIESEEKLEGIEDEATNTHT